jgi:hypothetical protein
MRDSTSVGAFNSFVQAKFRHAIHTLDIIDLAGIPESSKLMHVWSAHESHRLPEARTSAAYFAARNVFQDWQTRSISELFAFVTSSAAEEQREQLLCHQRLGGTAALCSVDEIPPYVPSGRTALPHDAGNPNDGLRFRHNQTPGQMISRTTPRATASDLRVAINVL